MGEYRTINKRGWLPGEWHEEPDEIDWHDEATNLPCLILRESFFGSLRGYVGVSASHPYYGKDWSYQPIKALSVHGGINFSSHEIQNFHIVEPDSAIWWLGFDCGHGSDIVPSAGFLNEAGLTYKNINYLKEQCKRLALQLKALEL
jgi:hypothetical protein